MKPIILNKDISDIKNREIHNPTTQPSMDSISKTLQNTNLKNLASIFELFLVKVAPTLKYCVHHLPLLIFHPCRVRKQN